MVTDLDAARRRVAELGRSAPQVTRSGSSGRAGSSHWMPRPSSGGGSWRVVAERGGPASPADGDELPLDAVAPALRLAHVLQWRKEFAVAERLFGSAIATAAAHDGPRAALLEAFGRQHLGKCLDEQGRDAEALACFEAALATRNARAAPADQLASTEQAARAARRRLASSGGLSGRSTGS